MGSFDALSPLGVKFGGLDLKKGQLVCMYCYFLNTPCGSYCKAIKNVVPQFWNWFQSLCGSYQCTAGLNWCTCIGMFVTFLYSWTHTHTSITLFLLEPSQLLYPSPFLSSPFSFVNLSSSQSRCPSIYDCGLRHREPIPFWLFFDAN